MCDRCSARALHTFRRGSLELHMCGHHAREFGDGLRAQGFVMVEGACV